MEEKKMFEKMNEKEMMQVNGGFYYVWENGHLVQKPSYPRGK